MLPPNVSTADFNRAIAAWKQSVGADWVFTSDEDVALYRDAYSPWWDEPEERKASAAVAPSTVEQVQAVVRTANQYKIPAVRHLHGAQSGLWRLGTGVFAAAWCSTSSA